LPETNPQRKQKQSDCNFSLPLKTHKKGSRSRNRKRGENQKKRTWKVEKIWWHMQMRFQGRKQIIEKLSPSRDKANKAS